MTAVRSCIICIHVLYTSKCLPNRCRFSNFADAWHPNAYCVQAKILPFRTDNAYWGWRRRRRCRKNDLLTSIKCVHWKFHLLSVSLPSSSLFTHQHGCSHFANVSQFIFTRTHTLMQLSIYTFSNCCHGTCSTSDFFEVCCSSIHWKRGRLWFLAICR